MTDGGEVTLNADQVDVLDGRLTGAAIVVDNSNGVASMLEGAIPSSVKDITVDKDGDLSTPDNLVLTVAQFRNLPNYASDNVVIRDSEIQITVPELRNPRRSCHLSGTDRGWHGWRPHIECGHSREAG